MEKEFIKKNLKVDGSEGYSTSELALLAIHAIMRPGEPTNIENAKIELDRLFFNARTYSLGDVGRYKINEKFGFKGIRELTLTKDDIVYTVKYILYLIAEAEGYEVEYNDDSGKKLKRLIPTIIDDAGHLGNKARSVRSS